MLRAILAVLIVLAAGQADASEILYLIKSGKLSEARRMIAESSTAATRDGNLLYCQALLESDGAKSLQFLEASFKAELSPLYLEDNLYQMALYYLAERNHEKLASTAEAYLQHWENGAYRAEILRLSAYAYSQLGQHEKHDRFLRRLSKENENDILGSIGQMEEAKKLYKKKGYIEAQKICRKLRKDKYDEVVVPALFLLSWYSLEQKRIDDAILYYNILKERYPYAIGLDDLIDRFGNLQDKYDGRSAEEITGTVYSIQAGVFSQKKNADRYAERLEQYGQRVEIKKKKISDKDYYVIYVGRFTSSDDAMTFKTRLEQSEDEAFHVVAR